MLATTVLGSQAIIKWVWLRYKHCDTAMVGWLDNYKKTNGQKLHTAQTKDEASPGNMEQGSLRGPHCPQNYVTQDMTAYFWSFLFDTLNDSSVRGLL